MLLLASAAPAVAAVPVVGIYSEGAAVAAQSQAGIESLRRPFNWQQIEPRPGHFDFAAYDGIVADAARQGLTMFPFLGEPPAWAVDRPAGERGWRPPRHNADFARFAAAAVRRWGPRGTFWLEHPKVPYRPIRDWQVWNEPNLPVLWQPEPDAAAYVRLLRTAARAMHAADPGVTVIAAGVPDSALGGVPQARYLRQLYAAGVAGAADALAVHAYAPDPAGVAALVARARRIMTARGDGSPLWVTEFGWASQGEPSLFTTTERAQARFVSQSVLALRVLSGPLRIRGVFAFRWQDVAERHPGHEVWPFHSGLLRADGSAKPALEAFSGAARLALPALADQPVRTAISVRRVGPGAVQVKTSRACVASLVVTEAVRRRGHLPRHVVRSRRSVATEAGAWQSVRVRPLAGRTLYVSALTADGADRISRSYPRTARR